MKWTMVRGVSIMTSPFLGFRAGRLVCKRGLNAPKPGMNTRSPAFVCSTTISVNASSIVVISFLLTYVLAASSLIS